MAILLATPDPPVQSLLAMPMCDRDELPIRVTRILREFGERPDAADALLPLVYEQLRSIAARRMADERRDHTLQATDLVHEAYLRLIGDRDVGWESRRHFYAAAAESMRRILIDHARKRATLKRGGDRVAVPASVVDLASQPEPEHILAVDEALTRLEGEDERAASVIRLRFFAGLTVDETAEILQTSPRTVMREWTYGRARLFQILGEEHDA